MCMRVRKKNIPKNRNSSFKGRRRNDLKRKRQRDAIEGKEETLHYELETTHILADSWATH